MSTLGIFDEHVNDPYSGSVGIYNGMVEHWEPQSQETPGVPGFIATSASWAEDDGQTL